MQLLLLVMKIKLDKNLVPATNFFVIIFDLIKLAFIRKMKIE